MRVGIRAVALLVAAFVLSGCTAAVGTNPSPSATAVTAQAHSDAADSDVGDSDVGNDRPQVTYDGLMVRRRVVIAIHSAGNTPIASLRKRLDVAASRRHLALTTTSASALDPAILERLEPDLVVALPSGATRADAGPLIDSAFFEGGRSAGNVKEVDVLPVLVHDLRFTVATAEPAALAKAISREGILSDALGNYTATLGTHELGIEYTGPLLSDHLVQSVRVGIARPARTTPGGVTVSPRSTTGSGVDMSREPTPAPAVIQASTGHHHGATPATVATTSHANPWPFAALGVLTAIGGLTLLLLARNRGNRSARG